MKTLPKLFALGAAAAGLVALSGAAKAQVVPVPSLGVEPYNIMVCPYECKDGTDPSWWQEVTTLMIMNADNDSIVPYRTGFLDGNGRWLGYTSTEMGIRDLDELNVCRTLQAAGITPPPAGMAFLFAVDADHGAYVHAKNPVGKFFKTVDEPTAGRITGIGKTVCWEMPDTVSSKLLVDFGMVAQSPEIPAILIEGTGGDAPLLQP